MRQQALILKDVIRHLTACSLNKGGGQVDSLNQCVAGLTERAIGINARVIDNQRLGSPWRGRHRLGTPWRRIVDMRLGHGLEFNNFPDAK